MAASCPSLSPQLPSLIYDHLPRSTATPRSPLSRHRSATSRRSSTLISKSTKSQDVPSVVSEDSLASMVGQLERNVPVDESGGRRPRHDGELAARWREIQGSDQWAGLLDPLDPLLRSELIRYGEFTQACYDAFEYDTFSRYYGSCKFPSCDFFALLGMADTCGYNVSRYLFATSNIKFPKFFSPQNARANSKLWSERGNWIGYIAASSDEESARLGRRDILVSWRGTVTRLEWVSDVMDYLTPVSSEGIPCPDPDVKVESGFANLYTDKDRSCKYCRYSAREQVIAEVRKLVERYTKNGEEVSITVTGHSLGGALAVLSAYDIAETGLNVVPAGNSRAGEKVPICVFTFAGPRVGNLKFKERFEGELGIRALRVVNVHDGVPKVPGIFLNEHVPEFIRKIADKLPWSYSHVGVELALDHTLSPYLKSTMDLSCFHNLEAHLHLLDGFHGRGKQFALTTGRDPALVNKSCDFLGHHHRVPAFWWQSENKGMMKTEDGRWIQPDPHRPIEEHPADTDHHLEQLGLASYSRQ